MHVRGRRISDASVMAGQLALAHTAADQGHSATPHSQLTVSPACVLPSSCMHTRFAGYTGKVRFALMQQLLYEVKAATSAISASQRRYQHGMLSMAILTQQQS